MSTRCGHRLFPEGKSGGRVPARRLLDQIAQSADLVLTGSAD